MSTTTTLPILGTMAVALVCVAPPGPADAATPTDPRAVRVAEATMEAMGGRDAWEAARYARFDFAVVREGNTVARYSHWWDRWTGRYRLEGVTPEEEPFRLDFDVDVPGEGRAWVGGREVEGQEARELLEMGHRRFINDSYWLFMPFKWLDSGVRLAWVGEQRVEGEVFDVVELSFEEGVGLTSNDRYWGWVSRDTGLMERWQFLLQDEAGDPGTGEPATFAWESWQETEAGVLLSTVKRRLDGGGELEIRFPVAELYRERPETFLAAAPPLP